MWPSPTILSLEVFLEIFMSPRYKPFLETTLFIRYQQILPYKTYLIYFRQQKMLWLEIIVLRMEMEEAEINISRITTSPPTSSPHSMTSRFSTTMKMTWKWKRKSLLRGRRRVWAVQCWMLQICQKFLWLTLDIHSRTFSFIGKYIFVTTLGHEFGDTL